MFNWKNFLMYVEDYFLNVKLIYYFLIFSIVFCGVIGWFEIQKWRYIHSTTSVIAEEMTDSYRKLHITAKHQNNNLYLCFAIPTGDNSYSCDTTNIGNSMIVYSNENGNGDFNESTNIYKVINLPKDVNLAFDALPLTINKNLESNNFSIMIMPATQLVNQATYILKIKNGGAEVSCTNGDC